MLTFNQMKSWKLNTDNWHTASFHKHENNHPHCTKETILLNWRVRCTTAGQWGKPTFHVVSSAFDETIKEGSKSRTSRLHSILQ